MVRQIFKGKVIAAAGPLPAQLTVENLRKWTAVRKGRFSEEMDESVTHLLCTEDQFNRKVPMVKAALKRRPPLYIVHFDWFEFSAVENSKLSEREYSLRNLKAKQRSKERERVREQLRQEKGKRDGEKFVNTCLFHIYRDRENFAYQIDITRDDESTGEVGQRYELCLWESNAKPRLYQFTAKFLKKKGDSQPIYYKPSPCSSKWRDEMDLFMNFFKRKTGIDWEDRVVKEGTTPNSMFQYTHPRAGKPVGRRLRHSYDYCLEVNAGLRGLPWPPMVEAPPTEPGLAGTNNALSESEGSLVGEQGSSGDYDEAESSQTNRDTSVANELVDSSSESVVHDSTTEAQSPDTEVSSEMKNAIEAYMGKCAGAHVSEPQQGSVSLSEGIDAEGIGNAVQRALRFPAMAAPSPEANETLDE